MKKELMISTETTGFSSPAESYVSKRLDIGELVSPNPLTTFFFRSSGNDGPISDGDIVVVDRSITPKEGDLIVHQNAGRLEIGEWSSGKDFWGVVTFSIKKITK